MTGSTDHDSRQVSRFPDSLRERIARAQVAAVVVMDRPAHGVPLARALLAGGVDVIELTLRTPAALEGARAIVDACPDMLVGLGTVLSTGQVAQGIDVGASFAVSPGLNPAVVREAQRLGLPFAPGVATPTDVECALELGCRLLKFFPSEPLGGLRYLNSMAAPYRHLDVQFIPLGGVTAENAADYLASDLVAAVGGSWLAPRDLMQDENWTAITHLARQTMARIGR